MHRILERQIKKYAAGQSAHDAPPEWQTLLHAVSDTYEHADEDRALLLRSLELSSKEFAVINERLRSEHDIIEQEVRDRTQELEYERTKLSEIAQHMATGAILLNVQGKPTFVNSAALELLSARPEDNVIHVLSQRFPSMLVDKKIQESLLGNSTTVPEAELNNRVCAVSFVSLRNESNIFGTLIWIDDITSQKLLERAKDQFLAIASHEMRTPLAVIRGNAELLLEEPGIANSAELHDETESIIKSAVRLLNIVNDFLDVQSFDQGRIALKIERVDAKALLTETINDLSKLASDKGLSLKLVASSDDIPSVYLDPYRLQQIFINLISNAIHYTQAGGVVVYVERDETTVRILFEDTGIGISPEDQPRLFKKFETSNTFLRSREYGSGLGLYISNILTQSMGGTLKLDRSEVGRGSTFSLTLPLIPKKVTRSAKV
ncbi:MAG TPA: PAS domain-containing sensor histidine kinase [Candidatus Paceibacterota bacterium]